MNLLSGKNKEIGSHHMAGIQAPGFRVGNGIVQVFIVRPGDILIRAGLSISFYGRHEEDDTKKF
jgi:hypothetical protein